MTRHINKTILLVEDDPSQSMLTAGMLKKHKYNVLQASDGKSSLEIVTGNQTIDLILMDINLGEGMDGIDTSKQILRIREIPIIFLSTYSEKEIMERVKNVSRYGYLLKGTNTNILISMIEMALDLFESNKNLKENLQLLNTMSEQLEDAGKLANLGHWVWNIQTKTLSWSNETYRIFGYSSGECNPSLELLESLIHPDDLPDFKEKKELMLSGKSSRIIQLRIIWPNGQIRYVEERVKIEFDSTGNPVSLLGTVQDVTERIESEKTINDYKKSLDNTNDCVFLFDAHTLRFYYVNRGAAEQTGYSTEELLTMHPYDIKPEYSKDKFQQLIQPLLDGKKSSINFETYHKKKNGDWLPVEIHLQYLKPDHSAEIPHFIAIVKDISERKKIETDLKIAATAFNSQEGIVITDPNELILRINPAFTEITGYTPKEAIGKNIGHLLASGKHTADFYRDMWDNINRTGQWNGELYNKKKNGKVYIQRLNVTSIKDENGKVLNYVGVLADITEKKENEQLIQNLAFYDPLTQLPNRRFIIDRLNQNLVSARRNHRHGAVMFIDLDKFKELNDTQGHAAGDKLLLEVAERLLTTIRQDDSVARLGGDEFIIALVDLNENEEKAILEAEAIAEKIRSAINEPYLLNNEKYLISPSIGISIFGNSETSVNELLKQADAAMYQSKKSGRNTISFFDAKIHEMIKEHIDLSNELKNALPDNRLKLFYQPQVDKKGNLAGFEALLRWNHPQKGILAPSHFISIAEESSLIVSIGQWVVETACKQLREWEEIPVLQHAYIAINVSAKQFQQPDFVEQTIQTITQTGIDPAKLKIEITESVVIENFSQIIEKMNELKNFGISFALDDFGTGYSSLNYLSQMPIKQIKIDQSFVQNIGSNSHNSIIIQTIIGMALNLGMEVIAEGVESNMQLKFLHDTQCHLFQGYLFSKPISPDEMKLIFETCKFRELATSVAE